jgi:8-oxo-dGTP diphosphatase
MKSTLRGLREGALTLTYNTFLVARGLARRVRRPTEVGVRVLVARGDQVLLVRHRGGAAPWSLPGGGVGRNESLAGAAVREVREEAGCPVELQGLLGVYHAFFEGMSNHIAVFVCAPLAEPRPPVGDLEIVDARFFRRDALPAGIDRGSTLRIAEHARGERGLFRPWAEE